MYPTLIKIGSFEITTFGLMMFAAFIVGGWVLTRQFRRYGLSDDAASSIVMAAALGGIAGAKIYYAILFRDWHLLLDRAGLVWYGGLIGGFLGCSAYLLCEENRLLHRRRRCRARARHRLRARPHRMLPRRRRLRPPDRFVDRHRLPERLAADDRRVAAPVRRAHRSVHSSRSGPARPSDAALRIRRRIRDVRDPDVRGQTPASRRGESSACSSS